MNARVRLNLPVAGCPKSRVVGRVVARLKEQIERGEFRSGDQLPPERELAHRLGVSRPSVRRAIAFLSAVGVIDIRHGSGTFVAAHTASAFHFPPLVQHSERHSKSQMREARLFLSAAIAKLAARRVNGSELSQLAEEVIEMHRSIDNRDVFCDHVERFHRILEGAAGNVVLPSLLHGATPESESIRELARHAGSARSLAALHHSLYVATRRHECARAAAFMAQLLRGMYRDAGRVHSIEAGLPSVMSPRVRGREETRLSA